MTHRFIMINIKSSLLIIFILIIGCARPGKNCEIPNLILRSKWFGEGYPKEEICPQYNRIIVKHTAHSVNSESDTDIGVITKLEKYQVPRNGNNIIVNRYYIGNDGKIYEGIGIDSNDLKDLYIYVIGDGEISRPKEQLDSLREVLKYFETINRLNKNNIIAYREIKPAISPGKYIVEWIKNYRNNDDPL